MPNDDFKPQELAKDNMYEQSRVGEQSDDFNRSETDDTPLFVTSSAYEEEGEIPVRFCKEGVDGGENVSIPVRWGNLPKGTRSLVLILLDPHPVAKNFIHWAIKDIPLNITEFKEGASSAEMPREVRELTNGYGETGYGGPQPPVGTGQHPYEFHIFALNTEEVELSEAPSWAEINQKLTPVTIASARYTGYYGR